MREPSPVPPEPSAESPAARAPSPAMLLAKEAAAGDVTATRRLLEAIAPRMMRVVQLVLGGAHADLDDVMQQSLIALVQALPSFRGECEPASYGCRIAVRTAVAARKRVQTLRSRRDDAAEVDAIEANHSAPSDQVATQRRKQIIRDLLEEIPEEQAESMALRFMLGWSLEEVARATRAPVNTVRSRLRLAKEALRRRIASDPSLLEALEIDT